MPGRSNHKTIIGPRILTRRQFLKGVGGGAATLGVGYLNACEGSSGSGGFNDESGGGGYGGNASNGGPSRSFGKKTVSRAEKQASGGQRDASGGRGSARTSGKKTSGRAEKLAPHRQAIARASEVRPGTAIKFEDSGGNPAVLVHLRRGNFVAYSAICTHEGCAVAFRRSGQLLACPCHGSIFDPANNAQVVNGPAQRPLLEIPVEVRGGEVVRT